MGRPNPAAPLSSHEPCAECGAAARLVADASAPWRTLVLLGSKVADAFAYALRGAITGDLSAWSVAAHEPYPGLAFRLVCLPHPSGLNRAWNEAGAFARARAMLAEYAPGPPYGEIEGGTPQ